MTLDQDVFAALQQAQQGAGDAGELFAFYEQLLRLLAAKKRSLAFPAAQFQRDESPATLAAAGEPYLTWAMLALEARPFYGWLLSIATLFEQRDPGAVDEVEAVAPDESIALARAWYETGTTERGPSVDALVANALAPYLEGAAEQIVPRLPLDRWNETYCPVCGGFPDFARWHDEYGAFELLCERCRTLWPGATYGCLFCGEDDPDQYGFYSTEDDLYRVMVCDTCGYYVKMIDQPAAERSRYVALLPAERLLTPGLDLLAAQEGYTRPLNLVRRDAEP